MNKSDWLLMKNYFDEVKRGTVWQRLKKQQFTKLSKRHYMQFPETISRELMKDEIILMQQQGTFLTAKGIMETGKIAKPTQYMDVLQDWIGRTNEAAIGHGDKLTNKLSKELLFLEDLSDATSLHEVAIALREHPLSYEMLKRKEKKSGVNFADAESYNQLLKNTMETSQYEKLIKDKIYTVTIEGERQRLRGEEVVKKINETYTKFFRDMHDIVTGDVPKDARGNVISPIPKSLEKYIVGY
jgi:SpoU rRNA methylase family enzyme